MSRELRAFLMSTTSHATLMAAWVAQIAVEQATRRRK